MGRTVRLPIRIALAYVRQENPVRPPTHLRHLVQQYRDLEYFIDNPEVADKQDQIWARLVAAVSDTKTVSPEKQLRRIERRKISRMTLSQKMDYAIAQFRAGKQVDL